MPNNLLSPIKNLHLGFNLSTWRKAKVLELSINVTNNYYKR